MTIRFNYLIGLLIFILVSVTVIIKSYLSADGFLTNDSSQYLAVAQRFLNGYGFSILNLFETETMHFARWPIGYPLMIATISTISGLSLFWASKVVNIIFLGLSIFLLIRLFRNQAYIYILLFCAGTYMQIFTLTWSEVPFIFGLLWLVYGLNYFIETSENKGMAHLFFASILLFFSRYVGFVSVPIIGVVALFFVYKKEYRKSIKLLGIALITFLISISYLYNNYLETGFITGIGRVGAKETVLQLLKQLYMAILSEINLVYAAPFFTTNTVHTWTTVLFVILFIALVLFAVLTLNKSKEILLGTLFLFTGFAYYAAIIFLRFTSDFDPFGYRILGPGTLLIFIGLIHLAKDFKTFNSIKLLLIGLLIISFYINGPKQIIQAVQANQPTYSEKIDDVKLKYEWIPSNSLVAFGDRHLQYTRTDSRQIYIYTTMDEFLSRIESSTAEHVYVEVIEGLDPGYYDKSVVQFMEEHRTEKFVKVK